jgi:HK97 family phage major capsid protein
MTLQEMRDKRNKAVADARALVDKAKTEKRDKPGMTADEQRQFDAYMKDAQDLKADITRQEQLEAEERELASSSGRRSNPDNPGDGAGNGRENRDGKPIEIECRGQKISLRPGTKEYVRASDEYRKAFRSYLVSGYQGMLQAGEQRTAASFASDIDADGGYLHAPFQFVAEIIKNLDNAVYVRQNARVLPVTSSDSLGIPNMSTRPGDADWTTEVAAISPDATAQFANRVLQPQLLTKEVDISMKLLRTAAIPPEQIVGDELTSIFARTEEKAFLTGDGSGKPLGVFTADNNGVPTSRDVTVGGTTAMTFDGLTAVKYGLKAQYRVGARWTIHRDGVKQAATLKDSNGQYLWQPSKSEGEPDMLLGHPVDESEYAPNTFTTGLYVAMFCNWKYYWIADLMALEVQRLNELLARNSKVGFIGRKYTDGQPVLAEAFSRGKLA